MLFGILRFRSDVIESLSLSNPFFSFPSFPSTTNREAGSDSSMRNYTHNLDTLVLLSLRRTPRLMPLTTKDSDDRLNRGR